MGSRSYTFNLYTSHCQECSGEGAVTLGFGGSVGKRICGACTHAGQNKRERRGRWGDDTTVEDGRHVLGATDATRGLAVKKLEQVECGKATLDQISDLMEQWKTDMSGAKDDMSQ